MNCLLDVDVLAALGFAAHESHRRVANWVRVQKTITLATCALTELGFVRVLQQAPGYGISAGQARLLLMGMKRSRTVRFVFLHDDQDIARLPGWARTPRQITDAHLLRIARSNNMAFVTLHRRIPGAYLIPD